MNLKKKYAQLFEGKLRSNDKSLLTEANISPEELVKKILRKNPRFKWLKDDLPKNYTLDDVKNALYDAGYGQEYDRFVKEGKEVNEANEVPNIQELLSGYIDSIEAVAESIRELEMEIGGGLEMYEEESGDYRVSQIMNQASRYLQSAEKNLYALQLMLKRKKDILG